jgi:hypothetical protein
MSTVAGPSMAIQEKIKNWVRLIIPSNRSFSIDCEKEVEMGHRNHNFMQTRTAFSFGMKTGVLAVAWPVEVTPTPEWQHQNLFRKSAAWRGTNMHLPDRELAQAQVARSRPHAQLNTIRSSLNALHNPLR